MERASDLLGFYVSGDFEVGGLPLNVRLWGRRNKSVS